MKVLFTGIYNLFNATPHNSFYNALSGGLYLYEAPQNTDYPYAVFFLVSGEHDRYFSGPDFEEPVIQFSLFSDSESASEVTDLFTYLTALYDDCSLTVTGYTSIIFERTIYRLFREPLAGDQDAKGGIWHYAVEYRGILQGS